MYKSSIIIRTPFNSHVEIHELLHEVLLDVGLYKIILNDTGPVKHLGVYVRVRHDA